MSGRGTGHEDAVLISSFLKGHRDAIDLVRAWVRSQIVQSGVGRDASAEDLEQDVLLQLIQSLEAGAFRGESRFETYVRTFSKFKVIDELRRRGRRTFVPLDDVDLTDRTPRADQRINKREEAARLRDFLDSLGEDCANLWRMILDGLSYEEMSRRLEISEGTLRVRVHRCRSRATKLRDERKL